MCSTLALLISSPSSLVEFERYGGSNTVRTDEEYMNAKDVSKGWGSLLYFAVLRILIRFRIDWIRIQSGQWIRIRNPDPDSESGSRSVKMTHKSRNFLKKFMF